MESTHIQKYLHTSPRKLRLVADMVRTMSPAKALTILGFTPKMAAKDLSDAIKTAMANAKNKGMSEDLAFQSLEINESLKMRRFMAGTRGRVKPFKRRMAHIKIVLSDDLRSQVTSHKSKVKSMASKVEAKNEEVSKEIVEDSIAKAEVKKIRTTKETK